MTPTTQKTLRGVSAGRLVLSLVACPPAVFILASLLATLYAKLTLLNKLSTTIPFFETLAVVSQDIVVYLLLAVFLLLLCSWRRWSAVLAYVVGSVVLILSLVSALQILQTGEQLNLDSLEYGFEIFDELLRLVSYQWHWRTAAIIVSAVVMLYLFSSWRITDDSSRHQLFMLARLLAVPAAAAILVFVFQSQVRLLPLRSFSENAIWRLAKDWSTDNRQQDRRPTGQEFQGYSAPTFVLPEVAPQKNVLLIVLESTRFDVSLGNLRDSKRTPVLQRLAQEGMNAVVTRSVVPHTTKSLFTILCAQFPVLDRKPIETADNIQTKCLPHVLKELGYRTSFFQSAFGTFEKRPLLARNMGYDHFESWEKIQGRATGYLSSEDQSIVAPFATWLKKNEQHPFFVTVLTSDAHHPYGKESSQKGTHWERYLDRIKDADDMLGELLERLRANGKLENTLVVVVGDHGEGFGEKGVLQHDNNYYDEGLRVPFVIWGGGTPIREVQRNSSLLDVTPTILGRLGIEQAGLPGVDVLAPQSTETPRWFACFYRCRGFVFDNYKVIYSAEGRTFAFDLALDSQEIAPFSVPENLQPYLETLHELWDRQVVRSFAPRWDKTTPFPGWLCTSERCKYSRPL